MGRGFLTGKIDAKTTFETNDFRGQIPRFTPDARSANQTLIDSLGNMSRAKGATPAQVALAWLLAKAPWIVPLFGTRRVERLDENLGALAVTLTAQEFAAIDQMSAGFKPQGERYPEQFIKFSES